MLFRNWDPGLSRALLLVVVADRKKVVLKDFYYKDLFSLVVERYFVVAMNF